MIRSVVKLVVTPVVPLKMPISCLVVLGFSAAKSYINEQRYLALHGKVF